MLRKDGNNSLMLLFKAFHSRRKVLSFSSGEDTLKRNPSRFGYMNVDEKILFSTSKTLQPAKTGRFCSLCIFIVLSSMNTG